MGEIVFTHAWAGKFVTFTMICYHLLKCCVVLPDIHNRCQIGTSVIHDWHIRKVTSSIFSTTLYLMHTICSTLCLIFIIVSLKSWNMSPCCGRLSCSVSVHSGVYPLFYCLHSSRDRASLLELLPPCLSPCLTMIGRNRFQCEALPALKTLRNWSKTSTDISTSRWSRTEMWPLEGITTLLLPTQCGTIWLAGGSEPSSTTMRKTPK